MPGSPAHLGSFQSLWALLGATGLRGADGPRAPVHRSPQRPPSRVASPVPCPAGRIQPGKGSAGVYKAAAEERERGVRSCRSICNVAFWLWRECEGCEH